MALGQGSGVSMGQLSELRKRLLFVIGALIVYRIGTFIPVPGVNPQALLQFMNSQQGTIVDVFNLFTGGALERFSLFALGVMPYISASIIMQLMSSAVPQLQQLKKEGSSGRQKITQYTRNFTVILAAVQAGGVAFALQGQSSVVLAPGFNRLDLTLARPFKLGSTDGELMLGVSDLFNDTEQAVGDLGTVTYLKPRVARIADAIAPQRYLDHFAAPGSAGDGAGMQAMPAEDAARVILDGIERDKLYILVGNDAKLMWFAERAAPKQAIHLIQRQMKALLHPDD